MPAAGLRSTRPHSSALRKVAEMRPSSGRGVPGGGGCGWCAGVDLLEGGVVEIRNEAARDLGAVYKSYPMLQGRVEISPLKVGIRMRQP